MSPAAGLVHISIYTMLEATKVLFSKVLLRGVFPFISQILNGHVFHIRSVKGCDPGHLSRDGE